MASRSTKPAILINKNPNAEKLFSSSPDIPPDSNAMEEAARFYHLGFEPNLTAENVISLACVSYHLGMKETQNPNNLLRKTLDFLQYRVLPSWNESIKALASSVNVVNQAVELGLIDPCLESIVTMALANPRLLGNPIDHHHHQNPTQSSDQAYHQGAKRQPFAVGQCRESEDLTTLSLQFYEPIMSALVQRGAPSRYAAASLYRYIKKWGSQRQVVEAVERLLPDERGLLPCKFLFEMLCSAISSEANSDCQNQFETRIGKQLNEATVVDLLMPYDIECVRRILKNFYTNCVGDDNDYDDDEDNMSRLNAVADLIEEFLVEVASDVDLKKETFTWLAEMSVATSQGSSRSSDGIYRSIDVYLEHHGHLTESEREEVCQVLDFYKMSMAALEHASQNDRLPVRVVLHALFVGQLQIRDTMMNKVQDSDNGMRLGEGEEEEEEEEGMAMGGNEEEVRIEMEKMGSKVMDLERECSIMRREIQRSGGGGLVDKNKKRKKGGGGGMWKGLKRKFGCISSMHDCDRYIKKKVHPRN